MSKHLYQDWCDLKVTKLLRGRQFHSITEIAGARSKVEANIKKTLMAHYEDPKILADRIKRHGFKKAAKMLNMMLPVSTRARSGDVGEILATEVVPAILPDFQIPIKRLRWKDGRNSAMRGEDIIGIDPKRSRFLKGESKSRASLPPAIVSQARTALKANKGRPSQHAMSFMIHRLIELGKKDLAEIFEESLLSKSIPVADLVHLLFGFSGNDASTALEDDLNAYSGKIEQHAVNLRIKDHQAFIASLYKP